MNYEKIYNDLVESRRYRGAVKEKGYEVHHCIPRCLGGSDTIGNLVKLTLREHMLAHRLLVKFLKGESFYKMNFALKCMSSSNKYKYSGIGKWVDYDNFGCNYKLLTQNTTKYLIIPPEGSIKMRGKGLHRVLEANGFTPRWIDAKHLGGLRTILGYLILSYKSGFNGVTNLRSSNEPSINIHFINKLEDNKWVFREKVSYGLGYYYCLTQLGALSLQGLVGAYWKECTGSISRSVSCSIPEVLKWTPVTFWLPLVKTVCIRSDLSTGGISPSST